MLYLPAGLTVAKLKGYFGYLAKTYWKAYVAGFFSALLLATCAHSAYGATEWPSGWNPEGKIVIGTMDSEVQDENGDTVLTIMYLYSDKTIVRVLNDRPISVVITLSDQCYAIWLDRGVVVDTPVSRVIRLKLGAPNWEKIVRGCQAS